MRIFIALPLPPDVATRAAALTPSHKALRPVRPELLHLTLAFVGRVADERLEDVAAAARAAAAAAPRFGATLATLGTFPESGRPHVVWLGLTDGAAESLALATAVRSELASRAVPFDDKPFRPHVTLARVRDGADRVEAREIISALRTLSFEPFRYPIDSLVAFESVLSPKGPRYTARVTAALGGTRA